MDYNYYTSPEQLQQLIDKRGLAAYLTFCQQHHVQVVRGEDWMYMCQITDGDGTAYWGTDLDAFSALIVGIHQYLERH